MDRDALKKMIQEILAEQDGDFPIRAAAPARCKLTEDDRMNTGNPEDLVYTRDLFTLAQSPHLGAGLMEMRRTTFWWTLGYDELDYVLEGTLSIIMDGKTVTAGPGEVLLIPKGSKIQFSVADFARFLYVTYPADWKNQQ